MPTSEEQHRADITEAAWTAIDKEFGLLTADEVVVQCGPDAPVHLLAVKRPEGLRYPRFQLGDTGPLPVLGDLRAAAGTLGVQDESLLLWMTAPTTWWDEEDRPVDHLDDPDTTVQAFRSHYGAEW
ncbi:hypothetical protein ACX8Z9_04525 [Arthrobacter halodurans]|uniref:Uncharacterized protein n=1 Tax=Arthrobacter halodurans TaxID=516699 RepID=A0ABV4UTT8_9MICC